MPESTAARHDATIKNEFLNPWRVAYSWVVPVALTACVLLFIVPPFLKLAYPGVFEDDFFYYLVAAKHILAGQGSTFDGSHMTNGYHPLWMVVFLVLCSIFHGKVLFAAFASVNVLLVLWSYRSMNLCFRLWTGPLTAQCLSAFLTLNLLLISGGMEITLAVPLLLQVCRYRLFSFEWKPSQAFVYGLLATLAVLARLDCALFILMLSLLDISLSLDQTLRVRLYAALPFMIGMSPILLYLGLNHHYFGTAMPISSHAKELQLHHAFSKRPLFSVMHMFFPEISTLIRPVILAVVVAMGLLLFRGWGLLPVRFRGVALALMLFLPVHLLALCLTSDWNVWRWYLYPFVLAGFGAFLVLLTRTEEVFTRRYSLSGLLASMLLIFAAWHITLFNLHDTLSLRSGRYSFYFAAKELQRFAISHPGTYAMGDRAGLVGYYLPDPLVQTEGLMMDRPFLENVRLERDLVRVLKSYGVHYFIATNPTYVNGCYLVREPTQAGQNAPVMRGSFCSAPLFFFESVDHFKTYAFDLTRVTS